LFFQPETPDWCARSMYPSAAPNSEWVGF
jgi:hypothetical protein